MDYWFPDNTVLCNFAVVDRLDLLRAFLTNRGRVVEAVAHELRASAERVPHLAQLDPVEWFGEPIRIEDEAEIRAVEVTRRGVFGGTAKEPLQHLGESQALYVIGNRPEFQSSGWVTDDGEAYRLATRRGILVRRTVDIFESLVANGEVTAIQAFELCMAVEAAGRHLLDPPKSVQDFGQ